MGGRRNGFTLIEMLTVVMIVGILASLIVPAIMRARNRARGIECLARLSNVGKAMISYESRQRKLPASGYFAGDPDDLVSLEPLHGWTVEILPELDQAPLYEKWNRKVWYFDDQQSENRDLSATPLDIFVCPVDNTAVSGKPHISYVVNSGFGTESPIGTAFCLRVQGQGGNLSLALDLNGNGRVCKQETTFSPISFTDYDVAKRTGIFFAAYEKPYGSEIGGSIPFSSIRDGLSQTILVSENLFSRIYPRYHSPVGPSPTNPDQFTWAGPSATTFAAGGFICEHVTSGITTIASCTAGKVHPENANNPDSFPASVQAINGPGTPEEFGRSPWLASRHPGGVHVFMCGGEARFLSEEIDGRVFAAMITPDGSHLPGPLKENPL